jgi:O-methyltransferase involved in polyketide biosynthesis
MVEKLEQNLSGVPETLLVPLWARAVEMKHSNPIVKDDKALEIMEQINYDFGKLDEDDKNWPTQVSVVVRTGLLDKAVKVFMDKNPDGFILNIGCGLDTRFYRLDNGSIQWYDLDLPESLQIRKQFFEETDRYKMIPKSVFDYSWINEINVNKPVLIIIEGTLMYFTEREVEELMNKLVISFKSAEMLIEITTPPMVKQSKEEDIINKQYQINATLKWGVQNGKELEKFNNHIKFIEEWHYFDFHRDRWKVIRWLSIIPPFKKRYGNRIVHLKFI